MPRPAMLLAVLFAFTACQGESRNEPAPEAPGPDSEAASPAPVEHRLPSAEEQIGAAVLALPEEFRAGARVLGYREMGGALAVLREGSGEMICLASDPAADSFHASCYHASLEPFMARGRELRAQGTGADEVRQMRLAEADAGTLEMPGAPALLYALDGPYDGYDPATGTFRGGSVRQVIYVPYATPETTGLSTRPVQGAPWLMDPGLASAHVMLIPGS